MKAVAITVAAIVAAIVMLPPMMRVQVEERLHDDTIAALNEAADALLNYVAVQGYFPCPADAHSDGHEPEGTNHVTGVCPTWYGFLPARELGMLRIDRQGYKQDGWGGELNRIRYAVSHMTVRTIQRPFTRRHGMRNVGVDALGSEYLLWVCGSADGVFEGSTCGAAPVLTSKTPAVIWSVGPNAPTGGKSPDEAENPNPNGGSEDPVFVSRPRSTKPGEEFDDVVTWIPLPLLVKRMMETKQLP